MNDLEANKYQMAEYRICIYGRRMAEWDTLARWVSEQPRVQQERRVADSDPAAVQRLPRPGHDAELSADARQHLRPLFEVTVDPSSHPALHHFLQLVVGFDMVDDESKPERRPSKHMRAPEEWDVPHNPAFSYYAYYVYANLYTLNHFASAKGLTRSRSGRTRARRATSTTSRRRSCSRRTSRTASTYANRRCCSTCITSRRSG